MTPPDFAFGIVVRRTHDIDLVDAPFATLHYALAPGPAVTADHLHFRAIAVADGPDLAAPHSRLARQAQYVLPGPVGETLYAFLDRATAEAAARLCLPS